MASLLLLSSCFGGPTYNGEAAENFDGDRFHNREPIEASPLDMIRLGWGFMLSSAPWPSWVEVEQQQIPADKPADAMSVSFINHATLLVQVDGLNILTDPVYSTRVSPVSFAGPKRVHQPGIALEDLPPIDVILISHNHYDHLDIHTLQQLSARQPGNEPVVVTGLGNRQLIADQGYPEVVELNWDQSHQMGDFEIVFVECRHRSGRGLTDHFKTLWGSFVVKTPRGNIYFAGDTAYGPHFKEAGDRYGPFTLAMLPIGAYEPRWFMKNVHTNPAEAVQAHLDLRSEQSIGMHFGAFQLTYEARDQPEIDLTQALQKHQLDPADFWTMEVGETRLVR